MIFRCLRAGLAALAMVFASGCRSRPAVLPASPPSASGPPAGTATSPVAFREVALSLGLDYRWGPTRKRPLTNLESFGSGCGFLDFNRDGRQDVIAIGEAGIRLFLAGPDGRFEDASTRLGLSRHTGYWTGLAVADYDGDRWPDLLIAGYRRLVLLRNLQGKGTTDVTRASGLDAANWKRWAASLGFADLDGDGDLDLVLMNYVQFGPNAKRYCELAPGIVSGCPPQEYEPEYTRLYRNDRGRFTDATIAAGANTTHGKGLALAFCDYNGDGRIDVYLGNDGTPSDLLRNLGGFRFRNVGIETGAAFGTMGQPSSAMGADWGDYDGDGRYDLASSGFSNEDYTLLRQNAEGNFEPISSQTGLALASFKPLGFGARFLDADNDGRLDLHFMNGHVYDNVPLIDPSSTYAQPMMLFLQQPDGTLKDVAATAGPAFADPLVGRGSAVGDYDNDGRQDLLAVDLEGRLRLYHNETRNNHHWLTVELTGKQPGNRLAYGAHLELRQGRRKFLRVLSPATSYLSSSDPRPHFGLGELDRIELLRVRWPSGAVQEARNVAVDRLLRWEEGKTPIPVPPLPQADAP